MSAFRSRGDEIACHGRTNSERQGGLSAEEESALIADATKILTEQEGRHPGGWLSPWISETSVTPDLLKAAGYRYLLDWCCDDQPLWLQTASGPLLSVPYPQEINDSSSVIGRFVSASDFADMIVDQFDEMLIQSRSQPLVMGIALHSHISGQPFRLRHLRRALKHCADATHGHWMTRATAAAGDRTIDAAGKLLMPGLINGHFHSPGNFHRLFWTTCLWSSSCCTRFHRSSVPPRRRGCNICGLCWAPRRCSRAGSQRSTTIHSYVLSLTEDLTDASMQAYADAGIRATVSINMPNVIEYEKYPYLYDLLSEPLRQKMRENVHVVRQIEFAAEVVQKNADNRAPRVGERSRRQQPATARREIHASVQ